MPERFAITCSARACRPIPCPHEVSGRPCPLSITVTAEGRRKNRRVEIIVSGEVIGVKVGANHRRTAGHRDLWQGGSRPSGYQVNVMARSGRGDWHKKPSATNRYFGSYWGTTSPTPNPRICVGRNRARP